MASSGRRRRSSPPSPIAQPPRRPKAITTAAITTKPKAPPSTVGEAIQRSVTVSEILEIASTLWLPTDISLAPHLKTQRIHHEKRQRWSSQLLTKLGAQTCGPKNCNNDDEDTVQLSSIWQDDRLARAVLASALPYSISSSSSPTISTTTKDRPDQECRWVHDALCGLHTLCGNTIRPGHAVAVHSDISHGISTLIHRAEEMAWDVSLAEAVELRWAARGLLVRLGLVTEHDNMSLPTQLSSLSQCLPELEKRVAALPFDILPLGLNWSEMAMDSADDDHDNDPIVSMLQDSIPFRMDTIITRTGSAVTERRGTAWVAEPGIGALAYSGKLMDPSPIPPLVQRVMRTVEKSSLGRVGLLADESSSFFDCALCNHYPHGEAACKFHTDPEHGTMWDRLTCVVSVGDERRFAFRPISGVTTWEDWDTPGISKNIPESSAAAIYLFSGDIVQMWGTCNDDFHHAVYAAEHGSAVLENNHPMGTTGRISLVLKRAIDRGGGKRGHGLEGQGRRARRRH